MSERLRFSTHDVERFAQWSADRNPLHVDEVFARQTHFGRPIVHGVLTVLESLRAASQGLPQGEIKALDIEFRNAAITGEEYEASFEHQSSEFTLALARSGQTLLNVRAEIGSFEAAAAADQSWIESLKSEAPVRLAPVAHVIEDFERGAEFLGTYPLASVEDAFRSALLSRTQTRVLALCSYITGMELPGLKSLFTRIAVNFHADADDVPHFCYRATAARFDRQFRMLDTEVQVVTPAGAPVATVLLRSYVPFTPANPVVDELAAHLAQSGNQLRDKVALVIGGSRGLGAEIAAGLALTGCHVYASARQHDEHEQAWVREVLERGGRLEFLNGDARDLSWCLAANDVVRSRHGRLDILVLNACAPPGVLRLSADSAARHAEYVRENLQLVETPLAAFAAALDESAGSIVCISSSFVENPPPGFGHYVAVKQAAEGLVKTICRERPRLSALIARPPVLQTRWNDTPAGVVGAMPSHHAALRIVKGIERLAADSSHVSLVSDFPPIEATAAAIAPARFAARVAATFTTDPLVPLLRFWTNELGAGDGVETAPYGQLLQSLLDPSSLLNAKGRGINLLFLRVRDWLRELADEQAGDIEFVRTYLQETMRDFVRAVSAHRAQASSETLLFVCPAYGALSAAESILLRQAEADLAAATAQLPGLDVVFASEYHTHYGVNEDEVHDALRDDIAHIPYRDEYLSILATIAARSVHRRLVPPRKVVVVDCDNTLWRGVVGEVGAEAVEFDDGHYALHRTLEWLAQSGVLICLCSKNEEADVWRVFETRADLTLRRESVVAAAINWQPKSQNIRTLASRLNLGLDSFVFIDDNPVECAEVRTGCPEVLTLEWPQDTERAERLLQHIWEFDRGKATKEDAKRTELYRQEFQRQQARAETLTFADFIEKLQLAVDIAPLAADDLRRAAQLTLRTNQFNFTTIRREEADVQALAASGGYDIRTVRVRDRFGDYGLVGLVIAERTGEAWTLDTFLLSCRVLGRGVEHRILADLGERAAAAGAKFVKLRIETTKRNTPARSFLESVIPEELKRVTDRGVECEVPVDVLAGIRFEPATTGEVIVEDDSAAQPGQGPIDASRLRRREAQIARSAFELTNGAALRAMIEGRPSAAAGEAPPQDDVATVVRAAFSRALRLPIDRVTTVDDLESLGCDSLRIVEITVALREKFAWLPTTLLFEHRSVSAIVQEIGRLSKPVPAEEAARVNVAARSSENISADNTPSTDIAVVGIGVRCADVDSPDDLWRLLSEGKSAVRAVPANRPHFLQPLTDARPHWAGLLDRPAQFDAEFFGVAPREAELMDPQLRLFLEVAWNALEDAGAAGTGYEANTGVFVGVMYGDYGFRANFGPGGASHPYRSWEGFSLANRLSQLLGFHGPSLAVNTACSSSGTALHLACTALTAAECRVAVVGGVNLILDGDRFTSLGRLGILSNRGRCEPFGADADGTVLGEGAGVVVLRPLADAVARGDRVYGVIKGSGLSTGSGTVGFTAPNPQAQADAIRRALKQARVDPRTVTYIETHGTGTALGDPIEVRGLTLGYGSAELQDPSVRLTHRATIGSIKPNIGHLEAGAGILGLIKILLQLDRGKLLPSITSEKPNPHIVFGDGPFDVQRELADWTRSAMHVDGAAGFAPRRAGLSSFGVGGANAHVIVEEAPAPVPSRSSVDRPVHVLALSGPSAGALQQQVTALREYIEREPDARAADVCHAINTGRKHFGQRLAMAAADRDALLGALREVEAGREARGTARGVLASGASPKIAFLFTGQGSQYAGMGRDLYRSQPVFRSAIDRCATIFDTLLHRSLVDVLFAEEGTGEANLLDQTGFTQPALFALEYALSELWRSWGIVPDVVLGHSVGEIGAMCVAGGVGLEDGLKLIAARGRLMQALPTGGVMTSVMADERRVMEAIAGSEDVVAIAAINAPGQVVISGAGTAVAEIAARLTADGIKTKSLAVSHAFHSPLMKPMLAEYERVVRDIKFSAPRVPFVSCVDGVLAGDEVTRVDYWLRNVIEPVRFAAGVKTLEAQKVAVYVEIGPHPVLLGMARQTVSDDSAATWLPSLRKDADGWQTIAGSVATLYARGGQIDWTGFDEPYTRTPVSVPTYRFTGKDYWLRQVPAIEAHGGATPQSAGDGPEDSAEGLYELVWRKAPATSSGNPPSPQTRHWIIFADHAGVGSELAARLCQEGAATTLVSPRERDLARVWKRIASNEASAVPHVVYLRGLDAAPTEFLSPAALEREIHEVLLGAVELTQLIARTGVPQAKVWIATREATGVELRANRPLSLTASPLWGFGRTYALEHPEHAGGLIDIAIETPPSAAHALAAELLRGDGEDQVALTESGRYVARLGRSSTKPQGSLTIAADGTYLVTGGLGALGLQVAQWLVANGARRLVLASRHAAVGERARTTIAALEKQGASVTVARADVSRSDEVDRLLESIKDSLRGVVHAAGVDTTVPLRTMQSADLTDALGGKAVGAWLLHERTRKRSLDFFICFSSMSSLLGAQGRAHYSAANAFLDALAHERRRLGLPATCINWGPWSGGGMATPSDLQQFAHIGNRGLEPDAAIRALGAVVTRGDTQTMVADVDWETFRPIYESRRPSALLKDVASTSTRPSHATVASDAAPWIQRLRDVPTAERSAQLVDLLRHEVADTLGFDGADSVPFDRTFYEIGMDSLMMADLVGRLKQRVGVSCTALVFNHPNVRTLAERMLERLPFDVADEERPPANEAVAANTTRTVAEDMLPEAEILAFQRDAFPDRRADLVTPRWNWMFVDSAARLGVKPRFWVHRDNGRIVGQMGSIPVRVKLGDDEVNTGWLVDTMVLPEYRSHAVGSRLMVDAHEDQPFSLSLGQTAEMREIQFRLGWKQVAPVQIAQLLVRPANVLRGKVPSAAAWAADVGLRASYALRDRFSEASALTTTILERFDERHDALWRRVSRDVTCAVVRDASYLNWKYADQPGQDFLRLEFSNADGVKGVAVWMFREPDGVYRYRRAFLMDLLGPWEEPALLQQIVKAACRMAAHRGADALLCHHVNATLTQALRACGFHLRRPERFFLIDPGPLAAPVLDLALSADKWLVTHGDSDIDRPW